MKYIPENINCQPIDVEKIETRFNESHKQSHPDDNKTYKIHCKYAVILSPKQAFMDDEFVGDSSGEYKFYFYGQTPLINGHFTMDVMPTWKTVFTLKDLTPYLLPGITLAEFTKERRHYNARIDRNEYQWMQYFNC